MKKTIIFAIGFFILLIICTFFVIAYPSVYPKGVTIDEPSKTYDGYTSYKAGDSTYILNMEGDVVHKWEHSGWTLQNILLKNGHLVQGVLLYEEQESGYLGAGMGPEAGGPIPPVQGALRAIIERDWNNNIVWTYEDDHLHHPFSVLPNGNILANFWTELPKELYDQVKGGVPGTDKQGIKTDIVRLIDHETKKTLWEWRAWEDLNISDYPLNPIDTRNHWPNVNFAKYLPVGNPFNGKESVLISLRRPNTLIIVDMDTKEVVWKWGENELGHQHDPFLLDNGNILVCDNGWLRKMGDTPLAFKFSRVIEVNPRINKIVWEYDGSGQYGAFAGYPFFSPIGCFIQRLPNGNTLITEITGRIFEVTPDKENVWEYITGIMGTDTISRYTQSEVNWPEKLPPVRPTGKKLGGRKIVDGMEIIEKTKPMYQIMFAFSLFIIITGIVLAFKIKSRRKNE